jgi:hypothetical protein
LLCRLQRRDLLGSPRQTAHLKPFALILLAHAYNWGSALHWGASLHWGAHSRVKSHVCTPHKGGFFEATLASCVRVGVHSVWWLSAIKMSTDEGELRLGPSARFTAKAKTAEADGATVAPAAAFKVNRSEGKSSASSGEQKSAAVAAEGKATPQQFSADDQKKRDEATLHPLQHEWCFWFNGKDKLDARRKPIYGSGQEVFGKFSTVEDFWTIYNNLVTANKVIAKQEYGVFKSGIAPKWEDPANGVGGAWHLCFDTTKGKREEVQAKFNEAWLSTILLMIGEQFEHNDEINGAILAVRKDRFEVRIWVKTAAKQEEQMSIGQTWFNEIKQYAQTAKVVMKSHMNGPSYKIDA